MTNEEIQKIVDQSNECHRRTMREGIWLSSQQLENWANVLMAIDETISYQQALLITRDFFGGQNESNK